MVHHCTTLNSLNVEHWRHRLRQFQSSKWPLLSAGGAVPERHSPIGEPLCMWLPRTTHPTTSGGDAEQPWGSHRNRSEIFICLYTYLESLKKENLSKCMQRVYPKPLGPRGGRLQAPPARHLHCLCRAKQKHRNFCHFQRRQATLPYFTAVFLWPECTDMARIADVLCQGWEEKFPAQQGFHKCTQYRLEIHTDKMHFSFFNHTESQRRMAWCAGRWPSFVLFFLKGGVLAYVCQILYSIPS